jgi:hypothetical protein
MPAKPTYVGIDKILSAFDDKADTPFFSLWVGKARAEMNKDNDFDKAKEKLEKQIKAFLDEEMNEVFVIALHPEKKVSYKYEDCKDATLMYCAAQKTNVQYYTPAQQSNAMNYEIMQKLNAMESKINALEADDIDEDESEVVGNNEAAILDKINGILNSPLIPVLMGLFNKKPQITSHALASSDEDELTKILTVLFQKGVTIDHLKKLSEYPADKIKMLLSMM